MPDRATPLAPRDLLVLAALAGGPVHGYGIIRTVEEESESGVLLDPGNLYRVLRRMRRDGWVTEEPDDTRRRVYRLTGSGRGVLEAELARLERLMARVRPLLADG